MASAEQPLKKRKLYDLLSEPPNSLVTSEASVVPPQTPPPLSQDEIHARRRNRDEVRSVYEWYRRLKSGLDRKDARRMPEIEQAYLSLIAASRGQLQFQFFFVYLCFLLNLELS